MAEEPTLPRLPGPYRSARALFANPRKRGRGPFAAPALFPTSSDPAIFSSDDDPALDNYTHGRRKKRYVGSWFDQHPASSDSNDSALGEETRSAPLPKPRLKRQLRRQMDSGVWMAQGELTDTDDTLELEVPPSRLPLAPRAAPMPMSPKYSSEELMAQDIIRSCVDRGVEEVDLSHRDLVSISDAILDQINHIEAIPMVLRDVAFEPRDPSIRLYLSSNALREFPMGIINIQHLTVLSLRGNGLTELPPAIASLTSLVTLNVAQNRLRYLPGELLTLLEEGSSLQKLMIHPNPFFQVREPSYCDYGASLYEHITFPTRESQMQSEDWSGITTILRARSPVQFSDATLAVRSDFKLPLLTDDLDLENRKLDVEDFWVLSTPKGFSTTDSYSETAIRRELRGPSSLFELSLRAAVRHKYPEEIKALLEGDDLPRHFMPAFDCASQLHKVGGQRCCVCEGEMACPAAKWIEFREVHQTTANGPGQALRYKTRTIQNSEEVLVPFLRNGCSWKCVPFKGKEPSQGDYVRTPLLVVP